MESIKWSSEPSPVWQLCMQNEMDKRNLIWEKLKMRNACRPVKLEMVQNPCLIDWPSASSWSGSKLPTFALFWFSRISLSSSFGPHVDFSQRDLKVVHTQERQEHKHHFAWKKSWCLFIKRWRNWDSKTMQGFFEKEEVLIWISILSCHLFTKSKYVTDVIYGFDSC